MTDEKKNVWVSPRPDGKWAVQFETADAAAELYDTQEEAIRRGREWAQKAGLELIIQSRQGEIREKDSGGNDPHPPAG